MNSNEINMTKGSLFKGILLFSLPLVGTNLLQILFNMADSAVVGRFAGSMALGSVGSTGQLCFLYTGLLAGIGGGVNVLVAFYLGKAHVNKDDTNVSEIIHTSAVFCGILGLAVMLLGIVFSPVILRLAKTKEELFSGADTYMRIFLLSMPAVALYNFGNAVLSAHGNTRLPLIFLAVAGVFNVVLDLVLVIVFHLGVAGVAVATVVAQWVSCFLTAGSLLKGVSGAKLELKKLRLNRYMTFQLIKVGIPAGLQNMVFAVANIFIQTGINSFDAAFVAGNAATMNGDNLVYNIMAGFYTACATFLGQNYGAGNKKRVLQSYFVSLFYSFTAGIVLGILLFIFGHEFLSLFTTDEIVVDYAMKKFKIMTFSFGLSAFMDCSIAASRGLGKTFVPSIFVFIGSCAFRLLWLYTIFPLFKTIESLFLLYPASWALTALCEIFYFAYCYKKAFKSAE